MPTALASRASTFIGRTNASLRASSHASTSTARRPAPIRADVRRSWQSQKSLRMTLQDEHERHTFESYLSDGERVIGVTFPDGRRREKLDETTWRVRLLPFEFLGQRVTVYATLTLTPLEEGLTIGAKELEFVGLPKEMDLQGKVKLTMEGALRPPRGDKTVNGDVTLTLDAAVNDFVAMTPGLDFVVNGINDTVLANLQGSIEDNLLADYARWWKQCQRLAAVRASRAAAAAATE
jgi:hypothetical protein|tara:strand:+ start:3469 stop:4176 length:708 start_codon:yes stop_codon:yes gene_type:complete